MSRKNDDRWLSGPPTLPDKFRTEYAGLEFSNGLRESNSESVSLYRMEPWKWSLPGLVKISMRPKPRRSYSAENGFWLMRISRMDSFGGNWPPLKPSM